MIKLIHFYFFYNNSAPLSSLKMRWLTVIEGVEKLPEKQKYVFIRQVIEGRTFRELYEESGEPINTLIARKRYAIQYLQK